MAGGTAESNDILSGSKFDEFDNSEFEGDMKENEEVEEHMLKSKAKQEEERAKIILTRKEWDKCFDSNQFFIEEPVLPSL